MGSTKANGQSPQATISATNLSFGSFVVSRDIAAEQGTYTETVQISNAAGSPPLNRRNSNAPLGGPFLIGGQSGNLPLLMSSCGLPTNAQAYSVNFTAVPRSHLGYLTVWPAGQTRPVVSTLNAPSHGTINSNMAVVPTQAGSLNAFATGPTYLIVDVTGYFALA